MKHSTLNALLTGVGIATMAIFAAGASAAPPTQADMDFCNQKAAEVAGASKGSQTAMPQQPGAPSSNPTGGRITDSTAPGSPAGPTMAQPGSQAGSNPTGGRITDSTQPGMTPSTTGMAPIGHTDSAYRQAYTVCMTQRGQ